MSIFKPYFFSGSLQLPEGFNYQDSASLFRTMYDLAGKLSDWQTNAYDHYEMTDTSELFYFLDAYSFSQTFLSHHRQANATIEQCRALGLTPFYVLPVRLSWFAYNEACLVHADDNGAIFKDAYTKALKSEIDKLNPDFSKDMVSQMKAVYNANAATVYWDDLSELFNQSVLKNKGKFDYSNATTLLATYMNWQQIRRYQTLISDVLYGFFPAKTIEQKVKIPMRDGVKLGAYVYIDSAATEKVPAIVSLSPYPSGKEALRGNIFATNGYVYVYVDSRGRRESEGSFMPYEDDARDFYDIIDW